MCKDAGQWNYTDGMPEEDMSQCVKKNMMIWPSHMLRLGTCEGKLMKQPANPGPPGMRQ